MKTKDALLVDLADAFERVRVIDQSRFLIGDVEFEVKKDANQDLRLDETDEFGRLISQLTSAFYGDLYTRRVLFSPEPSGTLLDVDLVSEFQRVNANKDGWHPGWSVYKVDGDGRLLVHKGDRSRGVLPGEYSTYKWPGVSPKPGDLISIRTFPHSIDVQPAFFFAFGRTLNDQFDDCMTLRFYFNVPAEAVVELMAELTRVLNQYLIPFKFKAVVDPNKYDRADAAVLYVARRYYNIVASLVTEIQSRLQPALREVIPLFTKRLVAGVGMAEEPDEKGSFGMHRSAIAATAIVNAWRNGAQDVAARMREIELLFVEKGLTLERAYLNPNSEDIFEQTVFQQESRW